MRRRTRVIVIGAGMGGLTAAVYLAQNGFEVSLIEARDSPGGLASSFEIDGYIFDAGPYILLDRPGLDWVFSSLRRNPEECIQLRAIDEIYEVESPDSTPVSFYSSLEKTALRLDEVHRGAGALYSNFVERMRAIHEKLRPLLFAARPSPIDVLRCGGLPALKFLARSLSAVLQQTGLPREIQRAIAIWTHVAGQSVANAPAPMAFVPALIHSAGAYYCAGGIATIPHAISALAKNAGVQFYFDEKARKIVVENEKVAGVETARSFHSADLIVSACHGLKTYMELLPDLPSEVKNKLVKLPLQSPGICVYVTFAGGAEPPYLRFRFSEEGRCALFVQQSYVDSGSVTNGRSLARLIAPLPYDEAESGRIDQEKNARRLIEEWPYVAKLHDLRVHFVRTTSAWGQDFYLYKNSMNPVMTAKLMRRGRLKHRSPYIKGLYLAGSSTHPGQWVSFAGISGIHAARQLLDDVQ